VPPLGVKGEKLVIAVPTVRLCAVVSAVALIELVPLLELPPPPEHAVSKSTDRIIATSVWMPTEKLLFNFMFYP
jgi:hypothetical protein